MKMLKYIILPILLCSWPGNTKARHEIKQLKYLTILEILLPKTGTIINDVFKLWSTFLNNPEEDITSAIFSDKEQEILENLMTISSRVTELEHKVMETSDNTIAKLLHAFPKIIKLELNMHELKLIINQINYAEEQMQHYLALGYNKIKSNQTKVKPSVAKNQNSSQSIVNAKNSTIKVSKTIVDKTITESNSATNQTIIGSNSPTMREASIDMRIERYTLENLATWATDHSFNSLMSLLRRLNDLIVPNNDDGLFDLILQVSKGSLYAILLEQMSKLSVKTNCVLLKQPVDTKTAKACKNFARFSKKNIRHFTQFLGKPFSIQKRHLHNAFTRCQIKNLVHQMSQSVLCKILSVAVFVYVANTDDTYIKPRSKLPDISLVDNIREEIIDTIQSLWRNIIESNDVNQNTISHITLLREYERIHKSIKYSEDFINLSDYYLFASDWSYAVLNGEISNVNTFYETFVRFQEENLHGIEKPQIAWTDLAETYIQNSDFGVIKSLEKIHRYAVTETESENLFQKIQKDTHHNICTLKQSLHQTLYNLYNEIMIAELKGNTVLQFSYMILHMYGKGNFTEEAKLSLQNYQKYAKRKIDVVRKALLKADRSIYKCDPAQYVEGVTHTKLTNLLQGYIENEVNLNPYGTCRENCQYYSFTEYNGCFKNQFCAHQPQCRGKVVDCHYVDSDMNICTSSNPERRYDWVEYENGRILGTKGVCEKKNLFSVDSWWRYLFWHCSYCLCLCDNINQESDRYFNLRTVTSDIDKNKVVTGLRIVKKNQIIHIQIQQGVLIPHGLINRTSLSWKPVDNYTIDDDNVKNNVDYYTMSWLERALDVDEVFGPPEHVVTGLRFRIIGTHLNLEVRVTPINFTSGEVYKENHSYWLGNDNTDIKQNNPRTKIELEKPDVPIRKGPHTLISKHNQYIQFQPTSFETDVGQSTVPYLDSQALTSHGFPLSGIGLIHRGKRGSGGFIAPKIISYDFAPHLGLKKANNAQLVHEAG